MYRCSFCKELRKYNPRYIYQRKDRKIVISPIESLGNEYDPVAICCPKCFKQEMRLLAEDLAPKDIYADGLLI